MVGWKAGPVTTTVLGTLERYYDTVPRAVTTPEESGPFTLFVPAPQTSWSFYARPRLGLDLEITADDVRRVLIRQAELGLEHHLEWVDEVTPSLLAAVTEVVGDRTGTYPLLVRRPDLAGPGPAGDGIRLMTPDHPDLPDVIGAIGGAFDGTDGAEGATLSTQPRLIAEGKLIMVGGYDAEGEVVGGGSTAPRGDVAELMGIGVLPRARRVGLGSAITDGLVRAALDAGATTLFLSAGSDAAASIYRRVGFEDVGTACILELSEPEAGHE